MCLASQSRSLTHFLRVWTSLGVCEASMNEVPLPCPEWHDVQPNFSAGCLLLAPTNSSSRGCAQYSLMRESVRTDFEIGSSEITLGLGTVLASGSPARAFIRSS